MFNWLQKKKEKEKEDTLPVIVEVPRNPVDCVQPFEHSALSKIRELQTERDNINSELEELNNAKLMPETPEFNKYVKHLAEHMSNNFCLEVVYRWRSCENANWEKYSLHLLEESLRHCSYEVDFAKIACEIIEINRKKDRIAHNNKRLKQIESELQSLKKRLGVE